MHQNQSCEGYQKAVQFREQLHNHLDVKKMESEVIEFVKSNWKCCLGSKWTVQMNPGLSGGCPALTRYLNGRERYESLSKNISTFFAWHGTADSAVPLICDTGFDPNRRSGQVHGPGEYFGLSAEVSHGYSRKSGHLIVTQLMRVPETSTHGTFCYVVNNPRDWISSYVMPVAVVNYNNSKSIKFCPTEVELGINPAEKLLGSVRDSRANVRCPFMWSWRDDDGKFKLYTKVSNQEIETAYQQYLQNPGNPACIQFYLQPVIRLTTDAPTEYVINFAEMVQTLRYGALNRRPLRREEVPITPHEADWFFLNHTGAWQMYEPTVNSELETEWLDFSAQQGSSVVTITSPGRPERYQVNFQTMMQTNLVNNTQRRVERRLRDPTSITRPPTKLVISLDRGSSVNTLSEYAILENLETLLANVVQQACKKQAIQVPHIQFNQASCSLSVTLDSNTEELSDLVSAAVRNRLIDSGIGTKMDRAASNLEKLIVKVPPE